MSRGKIRNTITVCLDCNSALIEDRCECDTEQDITKTLRGIIQDLNKLDYSKYFSNNTTARMLFRDCRIRLSELLSDKAEVAKAGGGGWTCENPQCHTPITEATRKWFGRYGWGWFCQACYGRADGK